MSPGIYTNNTGGYYEFRGSRVSVLGEEFHLTALLELGVVLSLVDFLGISYYVHLKESGFDLHSLPKEARDHLEALAAQSLRVDRIKKVIDADARD